MRKDLLIELGTEELPPKALKTLSEAFTQGIQDGLTRAGLEFGAIKPYATPRRLALLVHDVATTQPERRQERRGPALSTAYDKDGRPTAAAIGFARSCGVEVGELQTVENDKGAWLVHASTEPGAATTELIPALTETALAGLPIPKRMRWANRDDEFVRPVHWLVLLLGDAVIPATILGATAGRETRGHRFMRPQPTGFPATILGATAGRETRGHRFMRPQPIAIAQPRDYASLLESEGKVIADFELRRDRIRSQAQAAARQINGRVLIDPALLDEVTSLVEWPVALLGNFERRFLNVPPEALISTMQGNQKYFPVVDTAARLMPHFITIANLESQDPAQIRAGNERVIRPRFSDAEFFWLQDRKQPLAERQDALKGVVFQQRLGSLHDKCERMAPLARVIAGQGGGNPDWAERAARLAKCDLLTQMVQEFPELQGIMGRYYAEHDGEAKEVAQSLEDQYLPRFSGDELPRTATGRALALADRLDTLVGIFAIGQGPSGAKDPFALRRAALGVLRILIEVEMNLDLAELLECAARHFEPAVETRKAVAQVFEFIMERLRGYYLEQGFRPDVIEAVLGCHPARPLDADRRIRAVAEFRRLPEGASLAAANKRIRNILKKVEGTLPFQVRPDLLREEAEQTLAGRLVELSSEVTPLMETGLYNTALNRLVALREPVDNFFDKVMVMADDAALRDNRIALLNELSSLFLRVADFSRLQD